MEIKDEYLQTEINVLTDASIAIGLVAQAIANSAAESDKATILRDLRGIAQGIDDRKVFWVEVTTPPVPTAQATPTGVST